MSLESDEHLHGMASAWPEVLGTARIKALDHEAVLHQLLKAEAAQREVRSMAYQMRVARFPSHRDLSGFDFGQGVEQAVVSPAGVDPFSRTHLQLVREGRAHRALSDVLVTAGLLGRIQADQLDRHHLPDAGHAVLCQLQQCSRAAVGTWLKRQAGAK